MSGKPGAWVMALSPDEKTLLVPGAGRGNIVRINTITHQKEDFPAGDARGVVSAMGFRPKNGEIIFADSQGISRMRVVSFLRWDSDQKMVRLFLPIARGFHV